MCFAAVKKGSLWPGLFYSQIPKHQVLRPVIEKAKTENLVLSNVVIYLDFLIMRLSVSLCPLGVLDPVALQDHFILSLSVKLELDFKISKFPSATDILGFMYINNGSRIKDLDSQSRF